MTKTTLTLIIILILLLILKVFILVNSSYTLYSDDALYGQLTRMWIEKNFQRMFHPFWPPLFPALAALVYQVIPNFETALRLVSLVSGVLLLVPLFFLMKKTLSPLHAFFYVLTVALFSQLTLMSMMPLSDSLSMLLAISGLVAVFVALIEGSRKFIFLGSFLFGLNYLVRPEGTMFFFLTIIFLIFYFVVKYQWKNLFFVMAVSLMIFLITISLYAIAVRLQLGQWSLSPKFSAQIQQGHSFALNNRGTTWSQEVDSVKSPVYQSPYFKNGWQYVLEHFYSLKKWYQQKQARWTTVWLGIFPAWSVLIMVAGIVSYILKVKFWPFLYLLLVMMAAIPITIFVTPSFDIRYLAWSIPFFLFWFYLGVARIVSALIVWRFPRGNLSSVLTAVIFSIAAMTFPGLSVDYIFHPVAFAQNFSNTYDKRELREIGLWIKNNSPHPNPKIMMRHEGVEFYSQGETVYLPQVSYDTLLDYARKNKANFLVAWDEDLENDDKLSLLLDDRMAHPGLQKVYLVGDNSRKAVVYTLTDK